MSVKEIKESLKTAHLVIGKEQLIKELKKGKIKKVFLSSNCPQTLKKSLEKYAQLAEAEVSGLKETNVELGVVCKKPFSISVIGLIK